MPTNLSNVCEMHCTWENIFPLISLAIHIFSLVLVSFLVKKFYFPPLYISFILVQGYTQRWCLVLVCQDPACFDILTDCRENVLAYATTIKKGKGSPMVDSDIGMWSIDAFTCSSPRHSEMGWTVPFLVILPSKPILQKFWKLSVFHFLPTEYDRDQLSLIKIRTRQFSGTTSAVLVRKINPASCWGLNLGHNCYKQTISSCFQCSYTLHHDMLKNKNKSM